MGASSCAPSHKSSSCVNKILDIPYNTVLIILKARAAHDQIYDWTHTQRRTHRTASAAVRRASKCQRNLFSNVWHSSMSARATPRPLLTCESFPLNCPQVASCACTSLPHTADAPRRSSDGYLWFEMPQLSYRTGHMASEVTTATPRVDVLTRFLPQWSQSHRSPSRRPIRLCRRSNVRPFAPSRSWPRTIRTSS